MQPASCEFLFFLELAIRTALISSLFSFTYRRNAEHDKELAAAKLASDKAKEANAASLKKTQQAMDLLRAEARRRREQLQVGVGKCVYVLV